MPKITSTPARKDSVDWISLPTFVTTSNSISATFFVVSYELIIENSFSLPGQKSTMSLFTYDYVEETD